VALLPDLAALILGFRPGGRVLVGVDGPDAAGKSTFARQLSDHLDCVVVRGSIDDWHRPREERLPRGSESAEGYYRDCFDYAALVAGLLDPFIGGAASVKTRHFDYHSNTPVTDGTTRVPAGAILLFEGVFLLRPELRDRWDLAVYLHVPESVTLARVLERDRVLFGTQDAVLRRYEARYLPGQALYRSEAHPLNAAHVVLDNSEPNSPQVLVWRTPFVMSRPSVAERMAAAHIDPETEPVAAWRELREVEGARATVVELYELVAGRRGIAGWQLPVAERHALARSVMPLVWPGFSTTNGSERPADTIQVVDYDPSWPNRYQQWREVIAVQLGPAALRIEHVGSTSVPGLLAKPVIDVQVSVVDLTDEDAYVPPLEAAGLQLRSRDDLHRYFRPFPGRPRDVHVHVCTAGAAWEQEHLLFRDYLRTHPEACHAYAQVKKQAAARWSDDGIAYTDAKTEVILEILAKVATRLSPGTTTE